MPKKSVVEREKKRIRLISKYKAKREALKLVIKKSNNFTEIGEAQAKLSKLPLDSNPVRHTRRCQQCGRAHAVFRKFALCRICLLRHVSFGDVPGARKSSW